MLVHILLLLFTCKQNSKLRPLQILTKRSNGIERQTEASEVRRVEDEFSTSYRDFVTVRNLCIT
jgi:hypothetical protein